MAGIRFFDWLFSRKSSSARPQSPARRPRERRLRLEMLESKLPLAGNVSAVLTGGLLTLTGDAQSNAISILGTGGIVRVLGTGTTINGVRQVNFTGVTGISVFDNGGSDMLTATNLTLTGSFLASLDSGGLGNDVVSLMQVSVGGDVDIKTDPVNPANGQVNSSAGADSVTLAYVTAGDDVFVTTGHFGGTAGVLPDRVVAYRVTANNADAATTFSLFKTGNGADVMTLTGLTIRSTLFADLSPDLGASSANDVLSITSSSITGPLDIRTDDLFTATSAGSDTVTIAAVTSGSLELGTQGGSDVVSISGSSFGTSPLGAAILANTINVGSNGGFETNAVTITGSNFYGGLDFGGSTGTDVVNISATRFVGPAGVNDHTVINLNAGNDSLTIVACIFDDITRVTLIGGTGFDVFYGAGNRNTVLSPVVFPTVADFEVFTSI